MKVSEKKREIEQIDFRIPNLIAQKERLSGVRRLILASDPKLLERDRLLLDMLQTGRIPSASRFTSQTPGVEEGVKGWDGKGIVQVEEEVAHLRERRTALVEGLPSREEIEEARTEHSAIMAELETQNGKLLDSWQRLLSTLQTGEDEARAVTTVYRAQQRLASEARNVIERVDLENASIHVATIPDDETALARGIASVLSQVATHKGIDPATDSTLRRAHEAVERRKHGNEP